MKAHCGQKLRKRPSFELMSLKRQRCFEQVVQHENERGQTIQSGVQSWQYDIVAYARPDLFYLSQRSTAELLLTATLNGIYVNGGDCAGDDKRQTLEQCTKKKKVKPVFQPCSPASDHMAVMSRRFAPGYFSAAELISQLQRNASFGCNSSFGGATGICECSSSDPERIKIGLHPECLLSSWLTEQGVPWRRYSWSSVFAWGVDMNGMVIVDARSERLSEMDARGEIPAPCTLVRNRTFAVLPHLERFLFGHRKPHLSNWDVPISRRMIPRIWTDNTSSLPDNANYLYRPRETLRTFLLCDPTSADW